MPRRMLRWMRRSRAWKRLCAGVSDVAEPTDESGGVINLFTSHPAQSTSWAASVAALLWPFAALVEDEEGCAHSFASSMHMAAARDMSWTLIHSCGPWMFCMPVK